MSAQAAGRTAKERTSIWAAIQNALANMDYQLIAVVATLLLVGLVMVFSASFAKVGTQFFLAQTQVGRAGSADLCRRGHGALPVLAEDRDPRSCSSRS